MMARRASLDHYWLWNRVGVGRSGPDLVVDSLRRHLRMAPKGITQVAREALMIMGTEKLTSSAVVMLMVTTVLFICVPPVSVNASDLISLSATRGGIYSAADIDIVDGVVYIAGTGGLARLDGGKLVPVSVGYGDMSPLEIHDKKGYSSSRSGLLKYDNGNWTLHNQEIKLADIEYVENELFIAISAHYERNSFSVLEISERSIRKLIEINGEYRDFDMISANSGWFLTKNSMILLEGEKIIREIDISDYNIKSISMMDSENGVAVGGHCMGRFGENDSISNIVEIVNGHIGNTTNTNRFHSFSGVHRVDGGYIILGDHETSLYYDGGKINVINEGRNGLCQSSYNSSIVDGSTVYAVGQEAAGIYIDKISRNGSATIYQSYTINNITMIDVNDYIYTIGNEIFKSSQKSDAEPIKINIPDSAIRDILYSNNTIYVIDNAGFLHAIHNNIQNTLYIPSGIGIRSLHKCGDNEIAVARGIFNEKYDYINVYNINISRVDIIISHKYHSGLSGFACDQDNIYILESNGVLNIFERSGKSIKVNSPCIGCSPLVAAHNGNVFLYKKKKLYVYSNSSWSVEDISQFLNDREIDDLSLNSIFVDSIGRVWITGADFVAIVRSDKESFSIASTRSIPLTSTIPYVQNNINDIDSFYENKQHAVVVVGYGGTIAVSVGDVKDKPRMNDSGLGWPLRIFKYLPSLWR